MPNILGRRSIAPVVALMLAPAAFADGYNESISGDLSNSAAAPTPVTLTVGGTASIIGVVGGAENQDWITFTVPAGAQLTSITLVSYASTDAQGFMGFQSGATFAGSPFAAGSYAGYAHFGTGAVNGALPPTNLIGANMLPIMADPVLAAGATGFTSPLGPGTYSMLFQQLGAAGTQYQFDFTLTPTPGAATLAGLAATAALRRRR
ncbi:MAG: hypothetical protein QM783_12870 [Phycisphaerales bacterium]